MGSVKVKDKVKNTVIIKSKETIENILKIANLTLSRLHFVPVRNIVNVILRNRRKNKCKMKNK